MRAARPFGLREIEGGMDGRGVVGKPRRVLHMRENRGKNQTVAVSPAGAFRSRR